MQCDYWDRGACHSCAQIQTPYSEQVARKQANVQRQLAEVGAHPQWFPAAVSPETQFRTKVKLVISGSAQYPTLGILDQHQAGVDLADCSIVAEPIRLATDALRRFISHNHMEPYSVPLRRGELKYIVITSGGDDPYAPDAPLMIRFVLRSRRYVSLLRTHVDQLRTAVPGAQVITANIHPVHEAIIDGPDEVPLTSALTLPMRVGDVRLQLGPRAFSQTNTYIASQLYRQAAAWLAEETEAGCTENREAAQGMPGAEPARAWYAETGAQAAPVEMRQSSLLEPAADVQKKTGDTRLARAWYAEISAQGAPVENSRPEVWDLYCGVGGFALHAALRTRARVTGVEVSADAVRAANRARADLGANLGVDAQFLVGDATAWAMQQPRAPRTVIVNPPRRGIGPELAHWLDSSGVRQVIYSSCNPATLATDLQAMPHLEAVRARLFDMFPHTAHCEVLVQLRAKSLSAHPLESPRHPIDLSLMTKQDTGQSTEDDHQSFQARGAMPAREVFEKLETG